MKRSLDLDCASFKKRKTESFLESISADVFGLLFDWLDSKYVLTQCRLVCREWNGAIIGHASLELEFDRDQWDVFNQHEKPYLDRVDTVDVRPLGLTKLGCIPKMRNLMNLCLSFVVIEENEAEYFSHLQRLFQLDLISCKIPKSLMKWVGLVKSLEFLNIQSCASVESSESTIVNPTNWIDMKGIENLTALKYFYTDKICDRDLVLLSPLSGMLHLEIGQVVDKKGALGNFGEWDNRTDSEKDDGFDFIGSKESLETLYLGLTCSYVLTKTVCPLKNLRVLTLKTKFFTKDHMERIASLDNLKSLFIYSSNIQFIEPQSKAPLLETLYLTNIGSATPHMKFVDYSKLTRLLLQSEVVNEEIMKEISKMRNLKTLVLNTSSIDQKLLNHIVLMEKLEELQLGSPLQEYPLVISNEMMITISRIKNLHGLFFLNSNISEEALEIMKLAKPETSVSEHFR